MNDVAIIQLLKQPMARGLFCNSLNSESDGWQNGRSKRYLALILLYGDKNNFQQNNARVEQYS